MSAALAYAALKAHRERVYNLEHLQRIATWDRITNMPAGGARARAAAQGELAALLQRMQNDPALDDLLARAADEPLDADHGANLALMRRERVVARVISEDLARRRIEATRAASQAWEAAKAANDWPVFAAALAPLLAIVREGATRVGDALGLAPYDALLDEYDRGLTHARVAALFGEVSGWLPDLTRRIVERQANHLVPEATGPFDIAAQKRLCAQAMEVLGFDFGAGRLDMSVHPFTGGVAEDVRLTTRYREDECLSALLGIVHETGHGRYQAGLPREWLGQPLGDPCSAAMHEAQALAFERQLAPTPAFAARLAAMLGDTFGAQPAFTPAALLARMTRVRPGLNRVDADEVTYPAHVILRVEIEAALIGGDIGVDDVPAWWDERMARLLGMDTRGDHTRGALQDIHWSQGMFGYFPAYLLGAMIAAQLMESFRRTDRDFGGDPERTDFARLGEWLAANVWSHGARYTTDELVEHATGTPLSPAPLRAHFERRYLK